MKICLFPHNNTIERFTYLTSNFGAKADLEICFPEEDFSKKNADIFILEEEDPTITNILLEMEQPPLIVIPHAGTSDKHLRYLSDFKKQFPKILRECHARTPVLRIILKNQTYFYRQKDIMYLLHNGGPGVYFRQGTKVFCQGSFQKLAKQLSSELFFPVGTDIFVNISYVSELTSDLLTLQNGRTFRLTPDMAEQVKNAYFKTKYLSNCNTL